MGQVKQEVVAGVSVDAGEPVSTYLLSLDVHCLFGELVGAVACPGTCTPGEGGSESTRGANRTVQLSGESSSECPFV